jgi:hypothetical protein
VRGQDHTTPRHHLHRGCGRQATHSETTPRQPSTKPNGSAQPRPPNAATPSASGGWSKATRSETTPRQPRATGVDKGLHGTKTHKHRLQASTADQKRTWQHREAKASPPNAPAAARSSNVTPSRGKNDAKGAVVTKLSPGTPAQQHRWNTAGGTTPLRNSAAQAGALPARTDLERGRKLPARAPGGRHTGRSADAGQRDEGTQVPRTGSPPEERSRSSLLWIGI